MVAERSHTAGADGMTMHLPRVGSGMAGTAHHLANWQRLRLIIGANYRVTASLPLAGSRRFKTPDHHTPRRTQMTRSSATAVLNATEHLSPDSLPTCRCTDVSTVQSADVREAFGMLGRDQGLLDITHRDSGAQIREF